MLIIVIGLFAFGSQNGSDQLKIDYSSIHISSKRADSKSAIIKWEMIHSICWENGSPNDNFKLKLKFNTPSGSSTAYFGQVNYSLEEMKQILFLFYNEKKVLTQNKANALR